MKNLKENWNRIAIFIIMALAGFLSFYAIGQEGYGNSYYTAAIKSMLSSWHNFFFASFDPGGYVTVDKPALGLWLQALSAAVFGVHGWSVILPEALCTVISVAVLYHLVRKAFGKTAGVVSALVLALSPILIAVSRTNNLDASLILVLLLATWALLSAAEKSSLKLLLLSFLLVGLGFNIKMLQAFMVLPAFYLVYWLTTSLKKRKRLLHLTAATALLLAVSLSWAVIVDLTPADQRPYVGSSQKNSVLELALGYNGIQRITGTQNSNGKPDGSFDGGPNGYFNGAQDGNRTGTGNAGSAAPTGDSTQNGGSQANLQAPPNGQDMNGTSQNNGSDAQSPSGSSNSTNKMSPPNGNPPGNNGDDRMSGRPGGFGGANGFGGGGSGGPGGTGENGAKGIFRIFNQQIAGQISWLIPMAFFGALAVLLRLRKRDAESRKTAVRYILLWAAWLIPMLGYFSIGGFFHRYYLSMLAPGIAALSGIGIVELWKAYMESGWKCSLLPLALVSNALLQGYMLSRYAEWSKILTPLVCGICLASAVALILIRVMKKDSYDRTIRSTIAVGFAALLIAPALWCYTPILYGSQTTLPVAGPELSTGNGFMGFSQNRSGTFGMRNIQNDGSKGFTSPDTASSGLLDFLLRNKQDEKFLVAVSNATSAAPYILQTGEPVMAVGGFSGSDPILTVEKLEQMVKNGEIRYFLIQGMGRGMGSQSEISNWVTEHGTQVTSDKWLGTTQSSANTAASRGGEMGGTLYDLAPEKGTK